MQSHVRFLDETYQETNLLVGDEMLYIPSRQGKGGLIRFL